MNTPTYTIVDDQAVTEIRREIVNGKTGAAYVVHERKTVVAAFCNGCERVQVL